MAKKIKLTRPELKRHRDALARFTRYLPMLKLKQQQLQLMIRDVNRRLRRMREALAAAKGQFEPYQAVLADTAGVDVAALAEPEQVTTGTTNVAGVNIPVFEGVTFPATAYSLFATPVWVDRALVDLRDISRKKAETDVLGEQFGLLNKELTKIVQRVNLFEKVKIPEAKESIRVIRIRLGDEMTAAVGRAKIAKGKLAEAGSPASHQAEARTATNGEFDAEP